MDGGVEPPVDCLFGRLLMDHVFGGFKGQLLLPEALMQCARSKDFLVKLRLTLAGHLTEGWVRLEGGFADGLTVLVDGCHKRVGCRWVFWIMRRAWTCGGGWSRGYGRGWRWQWTVGWFNTFFI